MHAVSHVCHSIVRTSLAVSDSRRTCLTPCQERRCEVNQSASARQGRSPPGSSVSHSSVVAPQCSHHEPAIRGPVGRLIVAMRRLNSYQSCSTNCHQAVSEERMSAIRRHSQSPRERRNGHEGATTRGDSSLEPRPRLIVVSRGHTARASANGTRTTCHSQFGTVKMA